MIWGFLNSTQWITSSKLREIKFLSALCTQSVPTLPISDFQHRSRRPPLIISCSSFGVTNSEQPALPSLPLSNLCSYSFAPKWTFLHSVSYTPLVILKIVALKAKRHRKGKEVPFEWVADYSVESKVLKIECPPQIVYFQDSNCDLNAAVLSTTPLVH